MVIIRKSSKEEVLILWDVFLEALLEISHTEENEW